jgi:hypothetical protein
MELNAGIFGSFGVDELPPRAWGGIPAAWPVDLIVLAGFDYVHFLLCPKRIAWQWNALNWRIVKPYNVNMPTKTRFIVVNMEFIPRWGTIWIKHFPPRTWVYFIIGWGEVINVVTWL